MLASMQAGAKGQSPKDHLPRSLARRSTPVCVLSSFLYEALLTKVSQSTPQLCSSWCTWACCNVCAYSLNVSHLVVTQLNDSLQDALERPPMGLATTCFPHVVTSEKPVKFPALCRLIPLYHEPMTTCFSSVPLVSLDPTTPLLPWCDGSTPSHGVPVNSSCNGFASFAAPVRMTISR
jgi:hypothetical protein